VSLIPTKAEPISWKFQDATVDRIMCAVRSDQRVMVVLQTEGVLVMWLATDASMLVPRAEVLTSQLLIRLRMPMGLRGRFAVPRRGKEWPEIDIVGLCA